LELHREAIEAAGLQVVAVGLGQPKHARRFGDKLAPSVACVTNEEPALHATYGVERGNVLRMVAPDAVLAGAKAAARGHTQGTATGDTQRLPGTFIVDAAGIVRYAYYGKHAGDNPDLDKLLHWWRETGRTNAKTEA
jgi:peroxiredoxin